jgi:hypothetical protein
MRGARYNFRLTTNRVPVMQINPPYGFKEIVPLAKTHRVSLPRDRALPVVFRTMNPLPVSYTEFPIASRDYPLVFISADEGKTFVPMLVLGLAAQQNLFVMPDNAWDPDVYLPAYVRRYPFCMTRVTVDGKEAPERVACVEKRAINDKGEKLFDDKGSPLPEWETRQKLLFEYEADLARTEEMCTLLARHQLLEPFTMQAVPNQGEPFQLSGMYRIAEARLAALDANVLKELVQKGVLGRVYAHLLSHENFQRLLGRRAEVTKLAAAENPSRKKLN